MIGTLTGLRTRPGESYHADDLVLFEEVADRAAAAIENARLFAAARQSEQRFRHLFEQAGDAIFITRRDSTVVSANAAAARLLGYERDELVGLAIASISDREDVERRAGDVARLLAGDVVKAERSIRRKDGAVLTVEGVARRLEDGDILTIVRDVTEQRARARRETARADELQALMDAVPAAVWIARDPRADVIVGNRWSYEVLRLPTGANTSMNPTAPERPSSFRVTRRGVEIPPDDLPVQRAARGEEITGEEIDIVLEDGTVRSLYGNARPVHARDGQLRGSVAAFIDITARKRAEQELRAANQALQEADQRKDEFLAVLSHELRNPLSAIRSSVYVLDRAPPGSDPARRAQAVIGRQMAHLTRLVDDLLDVTRIARGKVPLQRQRVDLGDLVRRTIEDHRALFVSNGLELDATVTTHPLWVEVDPTRMSQIVGNLLQNAAKFTPAGGRVEASLSRGDAAAVLKVADDGEGIAPQLLPRVFEPFIQADATLARSGGGLGLGLALVKGLIELHGGTVEVASAGQGRGAAFTVSVPLAAGADAATAAPEAASPPAAARRVLVVDDNVDAADTLREVLSMDGHEVAVVYDGAQALARARELRPHVVLCDIGLPDISGYDVARELRADPALEATCLVALSGYAQPEDRRRAAEAGFDDHVAKPVTLEKLALALALRR